MLRKENFEKVGCTLYKVLYFETLEQITYEQAPELFRKFMIDESRKYDEEEIKRMEQQPEIKKSKGDGMSFLF